MQWVLMSLASALSVSVASASFDPVSNAALQLHPRASRFSSGKLENAAANPPVEHKGTTVKFSSRSLGYLLPRQQVGRCGADFGNQRCGGNQCCSSYGYCGTEFEASFIPLYTHALQNLTPITVLWTYSWMPA